MSHFLSRSAPFLMAFVVSVACRSTPELGQSQPVVLPDFPSAVVAPPVVTEGTASPTETSLGVSGSGESSGIHAPDDSETTAVVDIGTGEPTNRIPSHPSVEGVISGGGLPRPCYLHRERELEGFAFESRTLRIEFTDSVAAVATEAYATKSYHYEIDYDCTITLRDISAPRVIRKFKMDSDFSKIAPLHNEDSESVLKVVTKPKD
ncbi:MAG: hypothetical protein EOP04_21235 [Proteobacteria bacterium]|nr:MAG: hypothetical protein EOP04_21235 [Pseudomonadota bacterium]